jgi:hypothetical protein
VEDAVRVPGPGVVRVRRGHCAAVHVRRCLKKEAMPLLEGKESTRRRTTHQVFIRSKTRIKLRAEVNIRDLPFK